MYLFWKNTYSNLLTIFKLGHLSFSWWVMRSPGVLDTISLLDMISKYFLPLYGLSFYFWQSVKDSVLWNTKYFSFEVQFIFFWCLCFWCLRTQWLRSQRFILLQFLLCPFWVNFCILCEEGVQLHSFACEYLVIPASSVKYSSFPTELFS